jgi:aryl-alcohol dehydrogenase-like predicted oxidoreductase
MKTRQLGTNGLEVSEIGFGCMGLNSTYSHSLANEESIALIRSAVGLGVTFFDTAEIYGSLYQRGDHRRGFAQRATRSLLRPSSALQSIQRLRRTPA